MTPLQTWYMAEPQIPTHWHPATYVVDKPNKVVWKQGSYAVAMGLKGKAETLIPGYTINLCTAEELVNLRREIEAKAEADSKKIQKAFWSVVLLLLEFIRANGKLLLAGSAGFGAAWGFFEYGSILGMIGGAVTFPCLLCGLFTVPAAFFGISWGTWDGFKSLIRWLDRVLDAPEIHEEQISKIQAVPHGWAEEMLAYVTDERDIYLLKRVITEGSNYRSGSSGEHWYLGSLRARYRKIKGID